MKTQLSLALAIVALVGWIVARPSSRRPVDAPKDAVPETAPATARPTTSMARSEAPIVPPAGLVEVDRMARKFVSAQRRKAATSATPPRPGVADGVAGPGVQKTGGKVITDPAARVALIFVGADPEAEAYWFDAINDPSLSANERQDLIEDLNEEGFPDPHHPTADDLPLIVSRLELIEELAWDPMDEVNSAAFAEAHKDLTRMAQVAQQELE